MRPLVAPNPTDRSGREAASDHIRVNGSLTSESGLFSDERRKGRCELRLLKAFPKPDFQRQFGSRPVQI